MKKIRLFSLFLCWQTILRQNKQITSAECRGVKCWDVKQWVAGSRHGAFHRFVGDVKSSVRSMTVVHP